MLKGSGLEDLRYDVVALAALTLFAMTIAVTHSGGRSIREFAARFPD